MRPLPASLALDMAPLRSEFRNADAERRFQLHHLADTQAQLRIAFLFCSVFYLGFAVTDVMWMGYTAHSALLVGARLLVVIIALTSLLLLRRFPRSLAMTRIVATVTEVAACAGFLLIAAWRSSEFSLHAISMAILIVVLYIYIPNRLMYALAVAVTATIGFVLLARLLGSMREVELATMATLLVLANVFGYVAARRYQVLWRDEFRAQTVLKNLSVRDPLTGCYNRRHLHEQLLETELSRAQRYRLSLTVIMCDLDHFKNVNDSFGHDGGDAVLLAFAGLMQAMTRDSIDSVVRYGGEEFLLILPETDLRGGVQLAERLRQALASNPVPHGERMIRATASFGVASIDFAEPESLTAQQTMIATADKLLYAAKEGGRNQVCALQLP
ncbi:GGDEF domain-containing protein [Rugamonas brunnea]|nr:GGDEF domain-containing protein [Rugamonas brunnea]